MYSPVNSPWPRQSRWVSSVYGDSLIRWNFFIVPRLHQLRGRLEREIEFLRLLGLISQQSWQRGGPFPAGSTFLPWPPACTPTPTGTGGITSPLTRAAPENCLPFTVSRFCHRRFILCFPKITATHHNSFARHNMKQFLFYVKSLIV